MELNVFFKNLFTGSQTGSGHGGGGGGGGSGALFSPRQQAKKKRKSRTAFTNHQIFELEKRFLYQKYLSPADRDEVILPTAAYFHWWPKCSWRMLYHSFRLRWRWDWPTLRLSPGSRTDAPNSNATWRNWKKTSNRLKSWAVITTITIIITRPSSAPWIWIYCRKRLMNIIKPWQRLATESTTTTKHFIIHIHLIFIWLCFFYFGIFFLFQTVLFPRVLCACACDCFLLSIASTGCTFWMSLISNFFKSIPNTHKTIHPLSRTKKNLYSLKKI